MGRRANRLTAKQVASAKPGRYGDGGGLYLVVSRSEARKWVFRFSFNGRVTEMGLGSADRVSLAEARDKAIDASRAVANGENPIAIRRKAAALENGIPTFGEVTRQVLESRSSDWQNIKHRSQWRSSLEKGAARLTGQPVDSIDTAAVLEVLTPVWKITPESASRLRGRIEAILDAAKAKGFRSGENPAAWRGHLSHLLPRRPNAARGHHAAMPYVDLPDFMQRLALELGIAARALEFAILTVARSNEVFGCRWSEIDIDNRVWTIPFTRMKGRREHRIPLSEAAARVITQVAPTEQYVFTSPRGDRPLSHVAMAKVLHRMKVVDVTVHGFRSSFRDWAGNETEFSREIAEAALAHVIGDKAEQAYRRGDALEKRRRLMTAWAEHCMSKIDYPQAG
jgi:integrase